MMTSLFRVLRWFCWTVTIPSAVAAVSATSLIPERLFLLRFNEELGFIYFLFHLGVVLVALALGQLRSYPRLMAVMVVLLGLHAVPYLPFLYAAWRGAPSHSPQARSVLYLGAPQAGALADEVDLQGNYEFESVIAINRPALVLPGLGFACNLRNQLGDSSVQIVSRSAQCEPVMRDIGENMPPVVMVRLTESRLLLAAVSLLPVHDAEQFDQNRIVLRRLATALRERDEGALVVGLFGTRPHAWLYRGFARWNRMDPLVSLDASLPFTELLSYEHLFSKQVSSVSMRALRPNQLRIDVVPQPG